jgi:hypothetical protein
MITKIVQGYINQSNKLSPPTTWWTICCWQK